MSVPTGASFQAAELVDLYRYRPPYAEKALAGILLHAPATRHLLDLGCGEGKIARKMTRHFDQVTAVDPSANMIALGQSLENGEADNLTWIEARAETASLAGRYDVVTFASSIHWMDPARLFAALDPHLGPGHLLAVISGDVPHDPPWHDDWRAFLAVWVPRITGRSLDAETWHASRTRYQDHVAVLESQSHLGEPFRQSIADFIRCQHSRDTFALPAMGDQASVFQRELDALLKPHADAEGMLTYRVQTHLTLARRDC